MNIENNVAVLKKVATCELCKELERREAVQKIWIDPYKPFEIVNDGKRENTLIKEGACLTYIVWD